MDLDRADVVVIGGGVVGLDVVLLDRGIPGWEASGRNGGWAVGLSVNYNREEARIPLALEAYRLWPTLEEELGAPTEFVEGGSLFVALTEEDAWLQDQALERCARWGVEAHRLVLKGLREVLPGVTDRALSGVFIPRAGHANPQLTCQAWVWALERRGVRVYANTPATGIGVRGGRVARVETPAGTVATERVVNAAGPWAGLVAGLVGRFLPVAPVRIEMLCTVPVPPLTRATFGGNGLYCRQALKGHLHFGGGAAQRVDLRQGAEKPTRSFITRGIARRFVELLPGLGDVPVLRTWAGVIDRTPDNLPIIDRLEEPEGMYVNAGFGGIGFSNSPGAGKAMAELVADGRCSFDISGLSARRFAGVTSYEPEG